MSSNNKDQKDKKEKWLIPLFIIVIVIIWFLFPWSLTYLTDKFGWDIRSNGDSNFGTFGDTFGALNTLFSGLAFATLIITLILQRKELQLQRQEVAESNSIAKSQTEISEQQAQLINQQIKESQKQNFYNLFLKFIEEKNQKKSNFVIRNWGHRGVTLTGNEVFKHFASDFIMNFDKKIVPTPPNEDGIVLSDSEELIIRLHDCYERSGLHFGMKFEEFYYFEYVEFILSFIKENAGLIEINKVLRMLLSYFTFHETICMACLCVTKMPLLKQYINELGLLRDINPGLLTNDQYENLKSLFNESAFEDIPSTTFSLNHLLDESEN